MNPIEFFRRLDTRARMGLLVGTAIILAAAALAGYWVLRGEYKVLFAGLSPEDATVTMAELDKQKIPYRLEGDGTAILVPEELVHKTRIRLLGQNLPLHGAIGFELFSGNDFGMTEFAQKVNYQRALQGEITRTILSVSDVKSARVLLALPEQGLFRKPGSRPKASITLALREGKTLTTEQVLGIQRLVSAAVPDIATQDVVIADEHGIALTAPADDESPGAGGSTDTRLMLKKATESYLLDKVNTVLTHTFGPDVAVASVDVLLNMDRVHITTEDVLPYSPAAHGGAPTGVLVRDRRGLRQADGGNGRTLSTRGSSTSTSESDAEYKAGKRIEQVISSPGTITRLGVTAVLNKPLDAASVDRIKAVIGNAVGASAERGDTVVVVAADQMAARTAARGMPSTAPGDSAAADDKATVAATPSAPGDILHRHLSILAIVGGAVLVVLALAIALGGRRGAPARLTPRERERLVQEIRAWMAAPVSETDK